MIPDPDYRFFDLAGEPYSVGQALATATAQFAVPAWWPPPPDLNFARACESLITDLCPAITGEPHGYADAQSLSYTELLRGVCRRCMRLRNRPPAYPERARRLEPETLCDGRQFVAAANHFRHPEMRVLQHGRKLDHSQGRWRQMRTRVSDRSRASFDDLPRMLADHGGPICGHQGGHTRLWSLAADLTERRLAYASGPACATAFEPVPWPGGP